jgi:phage terminase Nu1 subunit (DNA packaging protein)
MCVVSNTYLTSRDLELKYKVGRTTIDKWKKEGMPFIKKGRVIRFDELLVDKWIKEKPEK